jgi:SAM-dependent methyltransferase
MLKIKIVIVNTIKKSVFYWKYRHLFQRKVWENYLSDYLNDRRQFYKRFVEEYSISSVFEFGCASGPNYLTIKDSIKYFFGFDISRAAIKKSQTILVKKTKLNFLRTQMI